MEVLAVMVVRMVTAVQVVVHALVIIIMLVGKQ